MSANRILIALLFLAIALQGSILYRQHRLSRTERREPTRPAERGTVLDLAGLPILGNATAEIGIIEFSDYECPFCQRHATGVAYEIDKEFIQSGKALYAFVNNPLPNHPNAKLLATAAICAGNQGQYWEMHNALFTDKPSSRASIVSLKLKLDAKEFGSCLDSHQPIEIIERDMQIASRLKLRSTPTFAIGTLVNNHVQIRTFVLGAQPPQVFRAVIEEILND